MARLGYVRVSTAWQKTDQQRDALEAFECDRIFEDIASSARDDRKSLAALLDYAKQGDNPSGATVAMVRGAPINAASH
jgi:DNA invertase Pin-like site-specific DNA recombinase